MVKIINIFYFCCIFTLFSCTRAIRTSPAEFKENNKTRNSVYRITTFEHESFEFEQYSISEDTLIIVVPHKYNNTEYEIKLPFNQIKTMNKIEINKKKTTIVVSTITLLVSIWVCLVISFGDSLENF